MEETKIEKLTREILSILTTDGQEDRVEDLLHVLADEVGITKWELRDWLLSKRELRDWLLSKRELRDWLLSKREPKPEYTEFRELLEILR